MIAVIATGGKQYTVKVGDTIAVEKIDKKVGSSVSFTDVLLTGEGAKVTLGKPTVSGAKVEAKIVEQKRDKKIEVVKHHKRKRYLRRQGHRQYKTVVEITKI